MSVEHKQIVRKHCAQLRILEEWLNTLAEETQRDELEMRNAANPTKAFADPIVTDVAYSMREWLDSLRYAIGELSE